jgi:RNA polymerase sigma-70 factor, ECF subfamily
VVDDGASSSIDMSKGALRHPAPDRESTVNSGEMLRRAQAGDTRALSGLFRHHRGALIRWARGRLPRWARRIADTADLVQDVLLQTFRRIDRFEDRGQGALQGYLRQAVMNRIRDELRRIERRPTTDLDEQLLEPADPALSPLDVVLDAERTRRYKQALSTLGEAERMLIVARFEMGYTYEQLALISERPGPEAARKALRRAVLKLAKTMSNG